MPGQPQHTKRPRSGDSDNIELDMDSQLAAKQRRRSAGLHATQGSQEPAEAAESAVPEESANGLPGADHHSSAQPASELQSKGMGDQEADEAETVLHTKTVEEGIANLERRYADYMAEMDALMNAGVEFLDKCKEAFLAQMNSGKMDLKAYKERMIEAWVQTSKETLDGNMRLDQARTLVHSLGLHAQQP